jgi:hypothetical protein
VFLTISGLICSFRFFGLFRFISKQICLFRLFRNGSETPKQTETNRKNTLLVSRNKPKINRNRLCFSLFRFEPKKKFVCFEDTLLLGETSINFNNFLVSLKEQCHEMVVDMSLWSSSLGLNLFLFKKSSLTHPSMFWFSRFGGFC